MEFWEYGGLLDWVGRLTGILRDVGGRVLDGDVRETHGFVLLSARHCRGCSVTAGNYNQAVYSM